MLVQHPIQRRVAEPMYLAAPEKAGDYIYWSPPFAAVSCPLCARLQLTPLLVCQWA